MNLGLSLQIGESMEQLDQLQLVVAEVQAARQQVSSVRAQVQELEGTIAAVASQPEGMALHRQMGGVLIEVADREALMKELKETLESLTVHLERFPWNEKAVGFKPTMNAQAIPSGCSRMNSTSSVLDEELLKLRGVVRSNHGRRAGGGDRKNGGMDTVGSAIALAARTQASWRVGFMQAVWPRAIFSDTTPRFVNSAQALASGQKNSQALSSLMPLPPTKRDWNSCMCPSASSTITLQTGGPSASVIFS